MCAVILSRPINHRLGLRTIRTVLNDPYNVNSPEAVRDAGPEKTRQVMYDARTQHKEKTAHQLSALADAVLEKRILSIKDDDSDEALEKLKKEIKGLKALDLPQEAKALHGLTCEDWKKLDIAHVSVDVDKDDETRKRRAFVVLVERATFCEIESRTHAVLEAASSR